MVTYNTIKCYLGKSLLGEYKLELINNTYSFKDKDYITRIIIDDSVSITRENKEFLLEINDEDNVAHYELKKQKHTFLINVLEFTKIIDLEKNKLEITYKLESSEDFVKMILERK